MNNVPNRRVRDRLIAVAGLTAMWMLLWGVFSWATFFTGLIIAALVITAFPLPPVTFGGRARPLGLLRFAVRFFADLSRASVNLAWTAFRFGYQPRSAVIAVELAAPSDLNLTLCGEAVSLVPGSLIVDTDRAAGVLYIHVFDVEDRQAVERFRDEVHAVEARIVRAIGSAAELDQIANQKGLP